MVRLALMQIIGSTYSLRTGFIHEVSMGRFSTWYQRILDLFFPVNGLPKDSMRAFVRNG
jgi:hypothetical protein